MNKFIAIFHVQLDFISRLVNNCIFRKIIKTLVTGGAGFIGSHMVDLLLSKSYQVRVIDNLVGGHKKNLKHHLNNLHLKFNNIDICKLKPNSKLFKNVDYVFHFAGVGDIVPSIENPVNYIMNNVQGTVKVLEASRYSKVKKFIYAASASCYGINEKIIFIMQINKFFKC